MKVDLGKYNKNQRKYSKLVRQLYSDYPGGVILPPEYAHFVQKDLLRFLIRLARYKFVAKLLKKSDTVLEVGSGSGLGSIFLGQYAKHVTGLDIKTTEVAEATSINKRNNVDFVVQDLYDVPADKQYDVVVALDVIEHFSPKEGEKFIAKMSKHVRKNGMLIIGTPSIYSYPYQGKLSQASHIKCYDQDELVALIGSYFGRTLAFSMNDELVHTGNPKMAWYYFVIAFNPAQ